MITAISVDSIGKNLTEFMKKDANLETPEGTAVSALYIMSNLLHARPDIVDQLTEVTWKKGTFDQKVISSLSVMALGTCRIPKPDERQEDEE